MSVRKFSRGKFRKPRVRVELISASMSRIAWMNSGHEVDKVLPEHAFYERKLLIADRHIADGERCIAEQRLRVCYLRHRGLDTLDAEWLLRQFDQILEEMLGHRRMIVHKISSAP